MTSLRHRVLLLLTIFTLGFILLLTWHTRNRDDVNKAWPEAAPSVTPTITTTSAYVEPEDVPELTLDQALNGMAPVDLKLLDPTRIRTLVVTGDIIPARGVDAKIRKYGADYPFSGAGITPLLQSGDLTIGNLEAPLLDKCPTHNEGFTFCGQSSFANAMSKAGIDVVTLENNHISNYGTSGIDETMQHLDSAGIDHADSNYLSISTIRDWRIGVLAFTGIGGRFYPELITGRLKEARPLVDLLIVAFHWGKEYELLPTPDPKIAPDDPRLIARMAIESGADFIIGNHPHWVQGVEFIEGKLVNYAYGNFIFDQSWSQETQQGYIGTYTFYDSKLVKVQLTPITIEAQSQPNLPSKEINQEIKERIARSSYDLRSTKPKH